jgi:hypothetical protein
VSPASKASTSQEGIVENIHNCRTSFSQANREIGRWRIENEPELAEETEEDTAGAIELEFRRRMTGLASIPRHLRKAAAKAIRDWRKLAMRMLREKREASRMRRRMAAMKKVPRHDGAGPRPR